MFDDKPDGDADEADLHTKGPGGGRLQPEVAGAGVEAEPGVLGLEKGEVAPEESGLDLEGGHLSLERDSRGPQEAVRGLQLTNVFLQLKVELNQLLKGRGILRKRIC